MRDARHPRRAPFQLGEANRHVECAGGRALPAHLRVPPARGHAAFGAVTSSPHAVVEVSRADTQVSRAITEMPLAVAQVPRADAEVSLALASNEKPFILNELRADLPEQRADRAPRPFT